jgi:phospholipid transport system substrate-binding protein
VTKVQIRPGLVSGVALAMLGVAVAFSPVVSTAAEPAAAAADTQNPRDLINGVAQQLLKELQTRREELKRDPVALRKLIDETLLPHFDTQTAAQRVLAVHWRTATPEQRRRFIDAFYKFMLQTYGNALVEFTPNQLDVRPFKGDPKATTATVETFVNTGSGKPIPVNYSMRLTPTGWKAWDVTIEGISYVLSFQKDIGAEVNQKGLEAVIARLESGQPAQPSKPATTAK